MSYVLFTDSDCDMTPELAREYGYKTIISMPYSIDGKTIYPYEDFDTFNAREFYDMLRGGVLPNTSAISTQKYIDYFEKEFSQGNDILYVHFSAAMTMTFNNMAEALEELRKKYPDRTVYQIDTKGITTISLAICKKVGELYKEGKSVEEILKWAETGVDHFAMYFFADDLKFFKHSGRVSGLTATMGSILGIRPLIYMSAEGKMDSYGTARGRRRAIEAVVGKVLELGDKPAEHTIFIGHSDGDDLVQETIACLKEKLGENLDIQVVLVNPTAGSHCGPNGLGVCFSAIHR
jgi:DegV family protein with EDD domain